MKKFWTIATVFLFIFISIFTVKQTQAKQVSSSISTSGYAQVLTNDCYLYADDIKAKNKLFLLEPSYFVKVLQDVDNIFYRVKYMEFEGFVEKSKISFVEEYPDFPFLSNITFDIYSLGNVCMRTSPQITKDDKNIVCTIPSSTKNLTYYGKISGEEVIKGLGNVWYYSAYENENGKLFKGYVYAPLTNNISSIASSGESVTLVNINTFVPIDNLLYLNVTTKNMLIVITAIPTIAVVILLAVPSKIKQKNSNQKWTFKVQTMLFFLSKTFNQPNTFSFGWTKGKVKIVTIFIFWFVCFKNIKHPTFVFKNLF